MRSFVSIVILLASPAVAYVPHRFRNSRSRPSRPSESAPEQQQTRESSTRLHVVQPIPGSKLTPPFTAEEVSNIFKEFNITIADFDNDPEILKWEPSKEFFDRVAPSLDAKEAKKYAVQDAKTAFYTNYRVPILPQYKTFISDLMVTGISQTSDVRFVPDAMYAFGLCTQYYTIMKGYALQDEIDVIFNEMVKSIKLDPIKIREDAKRILTFIKEVTSSTSEQDFLNLSDGDLGAIFQRLRTDRFFKYTDAFGVGMCRMMELRNVEPNLENFERWALTLRWMNPIRLQQSWTEFSADQVKMQGVEAMQKQLLIREKKRAAERLEKKAAAFEDKRKALQELNEMVAKRREVIVQEQRELKKRLDPVEYERILAEQAQGASA
jgi:uncharacterized coiled-coil protein SlyX